MHESDSAIDPIALVRALNKANAGEEVSDMQIASIAALGPKSALDALAVLASPRARRLLANEWAYECPSDELLDRAIATHDADDEAELNALAVRTLIHLHTKTCPTCAGRLQALEEATTNLESDLGDIEGLVEVWSFLAEKASTHRAGEGPGDVGATTFQIELNKPDLYRSLTGKTRVDTNPWPRLVITSTPQDDAPTYEIKVRLIADGMRTNVEVSVLITLPGDQLRIHLAPAGNDLELVGLAMSAEPLVDVSGQEKTEASDQHPAGSLEVRVEVRE